MQHTSIDNLRIIARILLDHGADPNAEHSSSINGYTPLMLAAELDERSLFELMLIKTGGPLKPYIHPDTGEEINCWNIAEYFRANNVMDVLDSIQHHFKTPV